MNEETIITQSQEILSVKEWVITLLITAIPLAGLIMLFVWAFGTATPVTKANWAKAVLIWMAIGAILWVLSMILFGIAGFLTM